MEFPYQDSPHGSLVMPQLKEEEMIQSLTELEVEIENQIRNIDELNTEYLEKFGEEYE